jgi:hypothetical protein
MEEGWVVVWSQCLGEGLCKAQAPISDLSASP